MQIREIRISSEIIKYYCYLKENQHLIYRFYIRNTLLPHCLLFDLWTPSRSYKFQIVRLFLLFNKDGLLNNFALVEHGGVISQRY